MSNIMKKIKILAPAKVNLYLNVREKRDDGYHNIESVMQTVGLFDDIYVERYSAVSGKNVGVFCTDHAEIENERNIIYRAAEEFFSATGISAYDVSFTLEKRIPVCAGLGGGSSDAASALIALNFIYSTGLDTAALCEIGKKVGADVPFCIKKGTCKVEGIGDILSSCTPMPDCVMLICVPKDEPIYTTEQYKKLDFISENPALAFEDFLRKLEKCSLDELTEAIYNSFSAVLPENSGARELINLAKEAGCSCCGISGTGPSVFSLYKSMSQAKATKELMPQTCESFICLPVRRDYNFIEE